MLDWFLNAEGVFWPSYSQFVALQFEFVQQTRTSAAKHSPREPWHLQRLADRFQPARRDIVLANRGSGRRDQNEIIRPRVFRPLAQSEQHGKQQIGD